jgi:hypothetical protein
MKKLFFTAILSVGFVCAANAQVNSNAIGARLGGGSYGGGIEVSYQKGIGSSNRLELDLGLTSNSNANGFGLFAGYHWNWNIVESLNWYIGPGAAISSVQVKNGGNYIGVAVGGQIGLEWDFQGLGAPLLLSLDIRPMWDFLGDVRGVGAGAGLGIRYIF